MNKLFNAMIVLFVWFGFFEFLIQEKVVKASEPCPLSRLQKTIMQTHETKTDFQFAIPNPDSSITQSEPDSTLVKELDEIVVTPTRYEQSTFSSARSMTIATNQEIKNKNQLSILDVFDDKIGVWIEKRTTTTSDPIIRGLAGAYLLALVDGNSLSTFWGEGGFGADDMYGKIDGESVDHIEIVRGPSSVMYGSNALGGVLNFFTKKSPLDYTDKGFQAGGKIRGAYGTASDYWMGRMETWGASAKTKYFVGGSTHHSGDMRAGGGEGYIVPSGGKDWSMDMNIEEKINSNNFISLSGQYMNRPETYRSYRPAQSNKNERLGLNIGYRSLQKTKLFEILDANIYYQYKKDNRIWYTDNSLDTINQEGYAWWRTYSADIHALKSLVKENRLIYGISYHLDTGESPDDEQFSMETPTGYQKAAPGTQWHNVGFYIHDEWDIISVLTISAGVRYDYFNFYANDDIFYTNPGNPDSTKNKAISDPGKYKENAITASAAGVLHLHKNVNLAITLAHGFRMNPPSFGFRQTGQGVLVPNGLMDPVTSDMFEISPRFRTDVIDVSLSGYYIKFNNFQQPIHGEYNGNEYIDYNNNGTYEPDERVYVNTPNGDAYVTGIEVEFDYDLGSISRVLKDFRLIGGAMYNYGRMKFPDIEEMPFRFTHPARGIIKLRYDHLSSKQKIWAEVSSDIVGKFDQIEQTLLQSDVGYLEDPQDPNSGLYCDYGLPSYTVFDFRGGITLNKFMNMTLAVENIFDIRYRSAHSRMDASGRNILVGLEVVIPNINGIKNKKE